jgi:hypothetical protein
VDVYRLRGLKTYFQLRVFQYFKLHLYEDKKRVVLLIFRSGNYAGGGFARSCHRLPPLHFVAIPKRRCLFSLLQAPLVRCLRLNNDERYIQLVDKLVIALYLGVLGVRFLVLSSEKRL